MEPSFDQSYRISHTQLPKIIVCLTHIYVKINYSLRTVLLLTMIYLIKTYNIADFKIIYNYISLLKSSTIIINFLGEKKQRFKNFILLKA